MSTAKVVPAARGVLILRGADVRRLLSTAQCIAAVEEAFRLYGEANVPKPGVLATHVAGGGFHVKAGAMPFGGRLYYAAKVNANFPDNRDRHRLPTIQGAVLLFDAECGAPLAVMDSTEITGLRTGAATAVAAKYLARPNSRTLAILGCGAQARYQAAAIQAVLPINRIFAYDINETQTQSFLAAMQAASDITVQAAAGIGEATLHSDVIVTCTTARSPFLMREHVRPGTFVAAVGADNEDKRELDLHLLAAARVIPDVLSQAAQIGELHHALCTGSLAMGTIAGDLGDVVTGRQPARTSEGEIIIFDSTGMALQDVSAACAVYQHAVADGQCPSIALHA